MHLQVMVQMPDGTFQFRPLAISVHKKMDGDWRWVEEVPSFDSYKEAMDWAEFILPMKLRVE